MLVQRLSVRHFRNLQALDLQFSPSINLIYGANGSGKTSLLEAIATLSLARSFRTHKFRNLVQTGETAFTVFGRLLDEEGGTLPVGIQRSLSGEVVIKRGGERCYSAAELSRLLPLRIIDGHSFQLLEGAAGLRRQYLDWLVFHVEPSFLQVWRDYEKCLKQRNVLLRHGKIDRLSLGPWDDKLARLGERITELRLGVFESLRPLMAELLGETVQAWGLEMRFAAGWDQAQSLAELLNETRQRDGDLGYTRQGPHRSDLKLLVEKRPAVDVLSRGQQKLVICALLVAQGQLLRRRTGRRTVYLIDDLPAELDESLRSRVARWLAGMNSQVFVTGIEARSLRQAWPEDEGEIAMFHVKHGTVVPVEP